MGYSTQEKVYNRELASYAPDVLASMHHFLIYERNGLVQPSVFSDEMIPILRFVTVRGESGRPTEETFPTQTWVPVMAREINELHFEIRTFKGELVPFQYGSITMTLGFKRDTGL